MKNRIRRTMLFLNAQRASLVKDAYVYKPDCVIFDLEDAVAEREKDSARVQLYNTLKYHDYYGVERWVRINALDTPYHKEDIRAAVAGGCDGIRIPKTETAADVKYIEELVAAAEKEFGMEEGSTMLMAALESPFAVMNAYEICKSSERLMGVALSAGDYTRTLHARRTSRGDELFAARSHIVMAARAAGIMCFDTVHTDLNDMEGFIRETELIRDMGYDGKSAISPKQISLIHDVFAPTEKEMQHAAHIIEAVKESGEQGVGVFLVDGQMVDIAFVEGAQRILQLGKASGVYKGDLA
ncbi:aldolase/citrate lyase family protein [Lacrimispora sp.]|uniref:aldolase/citrate lyase family protein n=1 Tax=Lacrimispora sp. TaxID=2719234 RepID=UPI0039E6FD1B